MKQIITYKIKIYFMKLKKLNFEIKKKVSKENWIWKSSETLIFLSKEKKSFGRKKMNISKKNSSDSLPLKIG